MVAELAHDILGLGATGGGFFLGMGGVAIGDTCLKSEAHDA